MENKYYTPEIKEFHAGFEFEVLNNKDFYYVEGPYGWIKCFMEFGILGDIVNVYKLLLDKQIRVKRLDKEDVEECGWKHDPNNDGEEIPSLFEKHGDSLGFSIDQQMTPKDTCYLLYLFPDNFVIVDSIYKCGSGREEMLFRGYIKNKCELKRLMQQLNIQI